MCRTGRTLVPIAAPDPDAARRVLPDGALDLRPAACRLNLRCLVKNGNTF
jgi:hypothetical protein